MTPSPVPRRTCYSILLGTRFGMDGNGDTTFRINCHRPYGRKRALWTPAPAFALKRQPQAL